MEKSIDFSGIEKLNRRNFSAWKRNIIFLLIHEKILYTLTTSKPSKNMKNGPNRSGSGVRTKDKWEEHNNWVRALVLHCMNNEIILFLRTMELLSKSWMKLKRSMD